MTPSRSIQIYAEAYTKLPLTSEEIAGLLILSHAHYDDTCRSAGRFGGFVYGWEMEARCWHKLSPNADNTITARWRDIDLCLKILEPRRLAYLSNLLTNQEYTRMNRLAIFLMDVLTTVTRQTKEWYWEGPAVVLRDKTSSQITADNVSRAYLRRCLQIERSIGTPEGMPRLWSTKEDEEAQKNLRKREVLGLVYDTLIKMGRFDYAENYKNPETRQMAILKSCEVIKNSTGQDYLVDNFRTWALIPGDIEW